MICLSKNGKDEFVNAFAKGTNSKVVTDLDFTTTEPVVFRSIAKRELIQYRLANNLPFYYIDSGYFGNYKSDINREGKKLWHRIVKNGLQHSNIITRSSDRFDKLKIKIRDFNKQTGDSVLLALPSSKPCKFYGIDIEEWKEQVITEIRKYTDRPIIVREKPKLREDRVNSSIYEDLENAYVLVTFNSIAAVESVLYGVPAITLAPTAADPVCDKSISKIESLTNQETDKIYDWACHLAYGQFHYQELLNGEAWRILKNESC